MHAPGNSATIQAISHAFPEQPIRVFAEASHVTELMKDQALTDRPGITFTQIVLEQEFLHRPHIVSFRRFRAELAAMRRVLRDVPAGEPCLLILISATSTAVFAASLLMRLSSRKLAVQVGLHGNLNDLAGWRPRNPLARSLDMRSAMMARHPARLRFLVLEHAIRNELARRAPGIAARTDVLELPINMGESDQVTENRLTHPVRIGFVGLATQAKGISAFLEAASRLKMRYPGALEFHLVGRVPDDGDTTKFALLDSPVDHQHLPRPLFLRRLGSLHFVFLPYATGGYYELSASGALLDAITWLKPLIATRMPLTQHLFGEYGDIGYLCDNTEQMTESIEQVIKGFDEKRYEEQKERLKRARLARKPETLARHYREIIQQEFPGFFDKFPSGNRQPEAA